MEPSTKRKRQAEQRRKQLIDTELGLFAEKGFENTTTKDIAEAAGLAQGLIYHYFGGKEELLFAAADRHGFLPRLRVILAASSERPARRCRASSRASAHSWERRKVMVKVSLGGVTRALRLR